MKEWRSQFNDRCDQENVIAQLAGSAKAIAAPAGVLSLSLMISKKSRIAGLDHEKLTNQYGGRNDRLTDVHGRVVHEILS